MAMSNLFPETNVCSVKGRHSLSEEEQKLLYELYLLLAEIKLEHPYCSNFRSRAVLAVGILIASAISAAIYVVIPIRLFALAGSLSALVFGSVLAIGGWIALWQPNPVHQALEENIAHFLIAHGPAFDHIQGHCHRFDFFRYNNLELTPDEVFRMLRDETNMVFW
jgi:hypothetical protein